MDREQAIYNLKQAKGIPHKHETLTYVIQALQAIPSAEPCEDAISRQAVLDYIYNDLGLGDEENGKDVERQMELESSYKYIKSLPPVKPQELKKEKYDNRWFNGYAN